MTSLDTAADISNSLDKLTADYSTFATASLATKDLHSKENLTDRTISSSDEICCNLHDYVINVDCKLVFQVNEEGQSVVKSCSGYHKDCPQDLGPCPGDVLIGVDHVPVFDSYYAESLLDDKHREEITLRFLRGDQTPKALPGISVGGAPSKKSDITKGSSSIPEKDLEYFRKEFHILATQAFRKGYYKWALRSSTKVLSICKLMPECHHELFACHDLMSSIYDKLNLHSKALGHLQVALSIAEICSLSVVDMVDIRARMGRVCRHLKDYEVSIDHYNCALNMIRKHMDALRNVGRDGSSPAWVAANEVLISTYISLGKVYRLQGDRLDLALSCERAALHILTTYGYPKKGVFNITDKILCRVNICLILGLQGDLSGDNEKEIKTALKTLETGEHSGSMKSSSVYRSVSNFFELKKDWELAILYRLQEISIRSRYDSGSSTLASALWRVSVYYRYAKDFSKAFEYRSKTIDMVSTVYGSDSKRLDKYLNAHRRYCTPNITEEEGTTSGAGESDTCCDYSAGDISDNDYSGDSKEHF